jgi:hypothetical protein
MQNESDKTLKDVQSSDPETQLTAVKELQSLLKQGEYLNDFVENERIPILIKCLNSKNTTIQIGIIKAFTEIAKSSVRNAKEIVRENTVPHFIRLSHSLNSTVAAQSIHVIGILISKDVKLRDKILKLGFAEHLVEIPDITMAFEVLNETARGLMLLTLYHDHPLPEETVNMILPALQVLIHHSNSDIVRYTTTASKFLILDYNSMYDIYLEEHVIKQLMKLINHREPKFNQLQFLLLAML